MHDGKAAPAVLLYAASSADLQIRQRISKAELVPDWKTWKNVGLSVIVSSLSHLGALARVL